VSNLDAIELVRFGARLIPPVRYRDSSSPTQGLMCRVELPKKAVEQTDLYVPERRMRKWRIMSWCLTSLPNPTSL
jgi:hypothetical protein